jgi:DNA polymerase I-like protein with 3'-5' exonuclease and polymerase domains
VDVLNCNGVAVDAGRRDETLERLRAAQAEARERLRRVGYLVDQPGGGKALQSILRRFQRDNPQTPLRRTAEGQFSTTEEDLAKLAIYDPFFADYTAYRASEVLIATLSKMDTGRVYPKFGHLLKTGRTCCSGPNLQGLPRQQGEDSPPPRSAARSSPAGRSGCSSTAITARSNSSSLATFWTGSSALALRCAISSIPAMSTA